MTALERTGEEGDVYILRPLSSLWTTILGVGFRQPSHAVLTDLRVSFFRSRSPVYRRTARPQNA